MAEEKKTALEGKTASQPASAKEEAPPSPAPEEPPQPKDVSRAEKEKIVYLDLFELHLFQNHPFSVRDNNEVKGLPLSKVKTKRRSTSPSGNSFVLAVSGWWASSPIC